MGLENLFQGLKMFQDGLREYSTNRAIGEATDAVNQLNQSAVSDQQKRVAQMQLGNQLAAHLSSLGATGAQIEGAAGSIRPQSFQSPNDMMMQGYLQGNQDLVAQGKEINTQFEKPKLAAEEREFGYKKRLKQMEIDAELQRAMLAARGKGKESTLPSATLDKISGFDTSLGLLSDMQKAVTSHPDLVGPVDARLPLRKQFKDTAQFDQLYNAYRNDYVREMTGAGVSKEESERLFKATVDSTQTAGTFMAGLQNLERLTVRKKNQLLTTYKKAGFNLNELEAETQQRQLQQQQQQPEMAVMGKQRYKKVNGGWVPDL